LLKFKHLEAIVKQDFFLFLLFVILEFVFFLKILQHLSNLHNCGLIIWTIKNTVKSSSKTIEFSGRSDTMLDVARN